MVEATHRPRLSLVANRPHNDDLTRSHRVDLEAETAGPRHVGAIRHVTPTVGAIEGGPGGYNDWRQSGTILEGDQPSSIESHRSNDEGALVTGHAEPNRLEREPTPDVRRAEVDDTFLRVSGVRDHNSHPPATEGDAVKYRVVVQRESFGDRTGLTTFQFPQTQRPN